ncbi:ATP-dependent Clp protease ATP-binding subunit clpX [Candidatus Tremblaya princeps PCVAL]|nr:ATP-dependent Clp protease ATP-binding subunit clpX [Candidatus Tremblaya princeps PCVAL]
MCSNDRAVRACSFCGGRLTPDGTMLASKAASICSGCIKAGCILAQAAETRMRPPCQPRPDAILADLDRNVVGQDRIKRIISVAVYNHYKRIEADGCHHERHGISKSNILLVGPTGSGKTLIAQTMARFLRVPFAVADATTLTEAGYVGEDVEGILLRLLHSCDFDVDMAQRGIVYIDEIDKISRKQGSPMATRDISGEGVQQALLKILDGTVAVVPCLGGKRFSEADFIHLDTTDILFICGGSFEAATRAASMSTPPGCVGFTRPMAIRERRPMTARELIKHGLIPELVGRLPVVEVLQELTEDELVRIMVEPSSALLWQYSSLLGLESACLAISASGLRRIAHRGMLLGIGARGLRSIMEHLLVDAMYEVPMAHGSTYGILLDERVVRAMRGPFMLYPRPI